MLMQKIEAPAKIAAPAKRPPSRLTRTAAGILFVLSCVVILPLYLFALFAWLTLASVAQSAAKLVRGSGEAIGRAGEPVTGR